MLDGNIEWKDHKDTTEKKIAKKILVYYTAKTVTK